MLNAYFVVPTVFHKATVQHNVMCHVSNVTVFAVTTAVQGAESASVLRVPGHSLYCIYFLAVPDVAAEV